MYRDQCCRLVALKISQNIKKIQVKIFIKPGVHSFLGNVESQNLLYVFKNVLDIYFTYGKKCNHW